MNHIHVELEVLESARQQMQDQSDLYLQLYRQLYETVDEVTGYWSGKEQEAFMHQIHSFEEDFTKMHQLLNEYCAFLRKSILAYRTCQDEAERMAHLLVQ